MWHAARCCNTRGAEASSASPHRQGHVAGVAILTAQSHSMAEVIHNTMVNLRSVSGCCEVE